MDYKSYLETFQIAADNLDKQLLSKKEIEAAVVMYGDDSVVLKLYKRSWANQFQDPLTAASRIFFSVWISNKSIKEEKIWYNIHALKLRQLNGYSIQSRKFADVFRDKFKEFKHNWKNVSVQFGPLTLMEGWQKIDLENLKNELVQLANNFLAIEHLVDDTLAHFKQIK